MPIDLDNPAPKDLEWFIDAYLAALREGAAEKGMDLKDSAWLFADTGTAFKSADRPSRDMQAFMQYHEERLKALLKRATLFVYWCWGDQVASVLIMPVPPDKPPPANETFERILLPFPPPTFRAQPFVVVPPVGS